MQDVEDLVLFVAGRLASLGYDLSRARFQNFERLHMREAWQKYAGANLDDYLSREPLLELCQKKGYEPRLDETYEDLFYRIF
jgi:elongation factor P--beta-lysine ligase